MYSPRMSERRNCCAVMAQITQPNSENCQTTCWVGIRVFWCAESENDIHFFSSHQFCLFEADFAYFMLIRPREKSKVRSALKKNIFLFKTLWCYIPFEAHLKTAHFKYIQCVLIFSRSPDIWQKYLENIWKFTKNRKKSDFFLQKWKNLENYFSGENLLKG